MTHITGRSVHWKVCADCGETLDKASHSGDPCDVCGTILGLNCDHNWVYNPSGLRTGFTHEVICTKCHKTDNLNCTLSTEFQERGSCLEPWYCICGNVHAEAYWEHNWSAWETTGDTHSRHCTTPGCTAVETGTHEYLPTINCTDPVSCSICGMENGPALHTEHNWSSWINTGSGTHYRYCMNGGCSTRESESHHAAANNDHTVATVCEGCGAIVDTAAHEYTYSISYNDTGHWFNCVCGESQFGEHNYDPETHICADCKMMDPEFAPDWPEEPDPSTSPDPDASKDPEESKIPDPSESKDPTESKDPVDPKPGASTEPTEPKPGETTKPTDPKPGETTKPTDPKPGETTDPGKTDPDPTDPTEPDPDEPYYVDLDTNVVYFESVQKATSYGLMSGVGGGKFSPGENTDRETAALILYNYAGIMGLSQEYDAEALDAFDDADQVQPWAKEAMLWAVTNGIFVPGEDGKLNPKGDATRAEVATFSVAFVDGSAE